jgi:hypothetical protein
MNDRPGAHDAGLKCHVEGGIQQSVVVDSPSCITYCLDFGVSSRVPTFYRPVETFTDDLSIRDDDSPDRHFTMSFCLLREP